MKTESKWEDVVSVSERTLERIRVPGGWLYRSWEVARSCSNEDLVVGCSESMAFVPEARRRVPE